MKEMYLVSSGSYSDYKVEAIFTTLEKAEAYIKGFKKNDDCYSDDGYNDIKKIRVNPSFKQIVYILWLVEMEKNGEVIDCEKLDTRPMHGDYIDFCDTGYFVVDAIDKESAIKIANERRAYLIANEAWKETECR